jgi:hypothetical protein
MYDRPLGWAFEAGAAKVATRGIASKTVLRLSRCQIPYYRRWPTASRDICAWAPAGALIWINRNRPDIAGERVSRGSGAGMAPTIETFRSDGAGCSSLLRP